MIGEIINGIMTIIMFVINLIIQAIVLALKYWWVIVIIAILIWLYPKIKHRLRR